MNQTFTKINDKKKRRDMRLFINFTIRIIFVCMSIVWSARVGRPYLTNNNNNKIRYPTGSTTSVSDKRKTATKKSICKWIDWKPIANATHSQLIKIVDRTRKRGIKQNSQKAFHLVQKLKEKRKHKWKVLCRRKLTGRASVVRYGFQLIEFCVYVWVSAILSLSLNVSFVTGLEVSGNQVN